MSCDHKNVNGVFGAFIRGNGSFPMVFIFVAGKCLEGKEESNLKHAYERVNNIHKGEVYIIGHKTQGVELYTDDFSSFLINERNIYSKTRETYIKRALLAHSMNRYHQELSSFKIHSSIQHKLWGALSKSITTEMKVWELAFMMYPVTDILSSAMDAKYRKQRRELMLDILSCIKRGKIESILSLRREQEFWGVEIDKQVEIVVSLENVNKSGMFPVLVSLWKSFLGKKDRKNIDELVPEKISFEYVEGSCSMEALSKKESDIFGKYCAGEIKSLPQAIENKMKNISTKKGTFEDWELEGKSVGIKGELMDLIEKTKPDGGTKKVKIKKKWTPSDKTMKKYEGFYKKYSELKASYEAQGECKKYSPICVEVADILSVGSDAVIKGIKKYANYKNITL